MKTLLKLPAAVLLAGFLVQPGGAALPGGHAAALGQPGETQPRELSRDASGLAGSGRLRLHAPIPRATADDDSSDGPAAAADHPLAAHIASHQALPAQSDAASTLSGQRLYLITRRLRL